jgi:hypothetical protein
MATKSIVIPMNCRNPDIFNYLAFTVMMTYFVVQSIRELDRCRVLHLPVCTDRAGQVCGEVCRRAYGGAAGVLQPLPELPLIFLINSSGSLDGLMPPKVHSSRDTEYFLISLPKYGIGPG